MVWWYNLWDITQPGNLKICYIAIEHDPFENRNVVDFPIKKWWILPQQTVCHY